MEKSPMENLNDELKQLDNLLLIPGNILIFDRIKSFNGQFDYSDLEMQIIPEAQPHFNRIRVICVMNILFEIAFHVHLFSNQPFKVLQYLKAKLYRYEIGFRQFLKELLLSVIEDDSRFQVKDDNVLFVLNQLRLMDITEEQKEIDFPINIGTFEYFTGKDSFDSVKDFIYSFLSVRGFVQTKYEYYKKLLLDNWSPELLLVISELMSTTNENAPQTGIKRFLDPNILELKPNIAGIGLNFNELINRFRKK